MKKIAFLAILVLFTVSASVRWSSAQSATRGGNLLDALPDGNAVAVIDFRKIAGSSLWATINAQERFKSALDSLQSEMTDLGMKLSDVHTVALVFAGASVDNPTVAMTGAFEQNDLLARLRVNAKVGLTSEKYKDFEIYTVKRLPSVLESKERAKETTLRAENKPANSSNQAAAKKDQTSFVFHDANTIVAGSPEAVHASVDVRTGGRSSIAQNARLADAVAQNSTAAVRFAIAITPAITAGLQSSELPFPDFSSVNLIFGAIDVATGIDLNATLRSDTAEHAKSISERLNGLLGMAKGYLGSMSDPKMVPIVEALKTVNIVNADIDVKITGSVPMDLLNSLLSSSGRKGQ